MCGPTPNEQPDVETGAPVELSPRRIRVSTITKSFNEDDNKFADEDPKLVALVQDTVARMDTNGDGNIDQDGLTKAVLDIVKDTVKSKKKATNLKRVTGGLVGLVAVVAAACLGSTYVAVALTKELKVSDDGTLTKTDGETTVKTSPQGFSVALKKEQGLPTRRFKSRKLQDGTEETVPWCHELAADAADDTQCLGSLGCLLTSELASIYENSFAVPVQMTSDADGSTHNIQTQDWYEDATTYDVAIVTTNGNAFVFMTDLDGVCGGSGRKLSELSLLQDGRELGFFSGFAAVAQDFVDLGHHYASITEVSSFREGLAWTGTTFSYANPFRSLATIISNW